MTIDLGGIMISKAREILLRDWFTVENHSDLDNKSRLKLEGFINSYSNYVLESLNSNQLILLFLLFDKHSENTDHLSYSFGKGRRATINTANALIRRGLAYWDIPTSSNRDDGYELTLDRAALITEDYLGV